MTVNDGQEPANPHGQAHGQVSYLQVPAIDIARSASFYEAVFGWRIEPNQPGFEAPGLIGQWVTDRKAEPGAGLLAWINVVNLDAALDLVRTTGGAVMDLPFPDGPDRMLATVSDPGGNAIGFVMHVAR